METVILIVLGGLALFVIGLAIGLFEFAVVSAAVIAWKKELFTQKNNYEQTN